MSQRFFVSAPIAGERARLEGPEAHHLLHVMRAAVGDQIVLLDGTGREASARVVRLGRREVDLAIEAVAEVDRELPRPLVLGVALPRGERQRWLVEKLVELGAARLVPLVVERGVARPGEASGERLERGVIEAAKQCGRNRLMEIAPPTAWADFVSAPPEGAARWLAHPDPSGCGAHEACQPLRAATACYVAIGPEGGLTGDEVALARAAGWLTVSLGPRILRVETAAAACAALVGATWQSADR